MTCATCDLSGRCPCVMRRLERLQAKGLMAARGGAGGNASLEASQGAPQSNDEMLEAALQFLRDLNDLHK